ncbi:hypothetical protein PM082_011293 [Marasmius tenuissimus]|nr:hypothetical protein PM082_011293 [Marasmius tenuissimus]
MGGRSDDNTKSVKYNVRYAEDTHLHSAVFETMYLVFRMIFRVFSPLLVHHGETTARGPADCPRWDAARTLHYLYNTSKGQTREIYAVKCDSCNEELKLPQSHYSPYRVHRASTVCEKATKKLNKLWNPPQWSNPTPKRPSSVSSSTPSTPQASPSLPSYLQSPSLSTRDSSSESSSASISRTSSVSSLNDLLQATTLSRNSCSGASVTWKNGSAWSSYPWAIHDETQFPWDPIHYSKESNTLLLRSRACTAAHIAAGARTCSKCSSIPDSRRFHEMLERASSAKPHTPYRYLSHNQLTKIIDDYRGITVKLRAKVGDYPA